MKYVDNLKNKNYASISSLISAIIFFIIGSIIFTNPNTTVKVVAYILGGCFIIVGSFKMISYYRAKKKEMPTNIKDVSIGFIALVCGLILVIFSSTVEALIRIIIGAWILFNGINLLTNSIKMYKNKNESSKVLIILSILMILGGIYMILRNNLIFQMIGLFIILYSVIEIVGYIYYVGKN